MIKISYETDVYAWAHRRARAIRVNGVAAPDVEHPSDEVEDSGCAVRKGIGTQPEYLL